MLESSRKVSLLLAASIGAAITGALCFMLVHTETTELFSPTKESITVKEYLCAQCKTPMTLNNPVVIAPDAAVMNNKNFSPVITHISFDDIAPVIETQRLRIRPALMSDAERYYSYAKKPEVAQSTSWRPSRSLEHARELIKSWREAYKERGMAPMTVVEKASGIMIGTASFVDYNPTYKTVTVGYSLDSDYWNRGYGTEISKALIEYAIGVFGVNRVQAYIRIDNAASIRVCEKAGMSLEGTLREAWLIKDELLTIYLFAVLRKDIEPQIKNSIAPRFAKK